MGRLTMMSAGLLGLLGACGGDDDAADPDARTADAAPDPDANPEDACAEVAGHACVWLGISGDDGFNGDGHHRLRTSIYWSMDMLFMPDGQPWFIDWNNHLIRKVNADQTVSSVVGWTDPLFPGDGTGDATERSEAGADGDLVKLNHPTDFALAPDGGVLVMAWHNHKLRHVDPATGKTRILIGAGAGYSGDGGQASAALLRQPKSLVVDVDGTMYIGDQGNRRIRRIDGATGVITTIAGTGVQGSDGDEGLATSAQLNWEFNSNPEPSGGMALADGNLYIADTLGDRIRFIDLETGIIHRLAGTGTTGYTGDGGPAIDATLSKPRDLEIGPEGDLYFADTDNSVIRAIDLESGEIRTVAGTGELGLDAVDGKLATETKLKRPFGLEFDADGNLYIMDTINSRILKVTK